MAAHGVPCGGETGDPVRSLGREGTHHKERRRHIHAGEDFGNGSGGSTGAVVEGEGHDRITRLESAARQVVDARDDGTHSRSVGTGATACRGRRGTQGRAP